MESNLTLTTGLLAVSLEPVLYVSLIKIGIVVALLFGWAAAAQWVDRDTDVVKTYREQWNIIVLCGAAVATLVLLIPPWSGSLFGVGLAFWCLLSGGALMAYVMHRNGRVGPAKRVLTLTHLKLLAKGKREKKTTVKGGKGVRVQIEDHEGKYVDVPDEDGGAEAYQALQDFLYDLLWRRASDADVVAGKEKYRLAFRIDGVATEHSEGLSLEDGERVFRFLKTIAGLKVEEIRRPQTGHFSVCLLSHDGTPSKAEVKTSGTTAGERLSLRLEAEPRLIRLHELGFARLRLRELKKLLGKHSGMVLFSAPPQHGLTTIQYAVIRGHDAYINNIHSLERRPLLEVENVSQQRYDGDNKDVNYARMLQTVLRREPDIVLIGECEDRETAMIATRAAVAKRKIYMGINAKDTFDALEKYINFLGDPAMAARALRGVVNQRLVRILCKECREAFRPDPATLKKLNIPADKIENFYRPPTEPTKTKRGKNVVCQQCQGVGYVGRTGVYELLVVDPEAAKLIAAGAPMNRIKVQCRKNKMYYLQEEGLLRVIDGTTSMNEILRCMRTNGK